MSIKARILATIGVLTTVICCAIPAQASTLSAAQYMRNLNIVNSGATTDNNVVTFDPATLEMINGGLINSSLTGSAITDLANNDLIYMPKEPVRYKLVPYLESNGTQYIDTGIILNFQSSKVVGDAQYVTAPASGNYACIGGSYNNSTDRFLLGGNSATYIYNQFSSGNAAVVSANTNRNTYIADFKYGYSSINSTSGTFTPTQTNINYHFYLFGTSSNGGAGVSQRSSIRLYSCQIYDNGVLVRDFVPAQRTTDDVLGLLDRVNNVFYTNKGTGSFTSVQYNGTYYVCDYIESDGNTYIDTGFVPSSATDMALRVSFNTDDTNMYAAGLYDSLSGTTYRFDVGFYSPVQQTVIGNMYGTSSSKYPNALNPQKNTLYDCELNALRGFGAINSNVTTFTRSAISPTNSIYLFVRHTNNSTSDFAKAKLYSVNILENGSLNRHFIPCYNPVNQKPLLLDNVNNATYYASGTGALDYNLSGNDGTWCLYIPTVAANTTISDRLYISTENLNSQIRYFPGASGLVVNRNTSNTVSGSDDWNFTIDGQTISGDGSYLFNYGSDLNASLSGNTITFNYGTLTLPNSQVHNTAWAYYYGTVGSGFTFTGTYSPSYNSNYISQSHYANSWTSFGFYTTLTSNSYSSMIIKGTSATNTKRYLGYSSSASYTPTNSSEYTSGALTIKSLPTGSTIYPSVAVYNNTSNGLTISHNIYMIAFSKADNPLQYAALSRYGTSEAAIINNSANLLNDLTAVLTLANKCTGEFMWKCVQSTTFTNALNNSQYKNLILGNSDWAKALAWDSGSYSTPNYGTIALSTTQTVPVGSHSYDFRKEGNSISLYVDSNLVRGGIFNETSWYTALTALGYTYSQCVSYATSPQITFAQGGAVLFTKTIQQKKNGNNVGTWTWQQTDSFTFPDSSGQGNTGYPSFRETNYGSVNNGANLSVSWGNYKPANVAQYNAPSSAVESSFTGLLPPQEQPQQNVDLGNIKNVPFANVFESLLEAGGIPSQLFWLPIMMILSIAACGVAYHLTRDALISCIAGDVMLGLGCALSILYTVPLVIGIVTTIVLLVKRKTISL